VKPIVGRFVMDEKGARVEVSTHTFAELMAAKKVQPFVEEGSTDAVWILIAPVDRDTKPFTGNTIVPIRVVIKAPRT
jgi:hypothetical protein